MDVVVLSFKYNRYMENKEIMKVTIHELFHLFHCDKSMNDNYNIIDLYQKRYNINSDRVNTFEAYTEIWANILNCFLISNNVYKNFIKYINLEHSWSNIQAQKIFILTNLDKNITIDINKYTNVLAYFIIRKNIQNFKGFIKLFNKSICNNSKVYFEFLQNVNKINKKTKLIKNISKKNYIYIKSLIFVWKLNYFILSKYTIFVRVVVFEVLLEMMEEVSSSPF